MRPVTGVCSHKNDAKGRERPPSHCGIGTSENSKHKIFKTFTSHKQKLLFHIICLSTDLQPTIYLKMSGQWNDLPKRLLTVSFGAPLVCLMLFYIPHIFFQIIHLLCILEWLRLSPFKRDRKQYLFTFISLGTVYVPQMFISVYLSTSSSLLYLSGYLDGSGPDEYTRHLIHGLLLISVSFKHWILLAQQSFSHTFYVLFIVWNCDTGALVGGRLGKMIFKSNDVIGERMKRFKIGKLLINILYNISPSKSVTGFVGGITFGTLTAVYIPEFSIAVERFLKDMSLTKKFTMEYLYNDVHFDFSDQRKVIGLVLSIAGIIGDLVESAIKRQAGQKDSANFIPGHGGVLDRFDSTFMAVGIYLFIMNQHVYACAM